MQTAKWNIGSTVSWNKTQDPIQREHGRVVEFYYKVKGYNDEVYVLPESFLEVGKGGARKTATRKSKKGNRKTRQRRGRKQRGGVMEMSPMDFKTAYLSPPHAPTGQSVMDLVPREQYLRSPYGEYQKGGFQDEIIRPMSLSEAYPGKNLDPSGQPAY